MKAKQDFRGIYHRIRNTLKDRELLSDRIAERLFESEEYKSCDTVFAYYSVGSEVSTRGIIEKALLDDKNVTLPVCLDKNGLMEFYYIEGLHGLTEGLFGIPEPRRGKKAESDGKSLCLVPGLAFTKKGFRLGYGGGYYDRFLQDFKGIKVGLSYDSSIAEFLPHEKTDIKVDLIFTDKEYITIKEEEDG